MLTPDGIDDFVQMTLPTFKTYKWTDLSMEHQEYVSSRLITEKKVQEDGGSKISWRIQTKNSGAASNTGLYAPDNTNVTDVMTSAEVPWAFQTTNFSYDEREDIFQSDRTTIIRELMVRDHDAMNSMAELNEENFWSKPTGPTDKRPMGIPYWIVKDTTTSGAFEGKNPSGFASGCAGVSSTTVTRWRNWTFGYTSVSADDLVIKLKKAIVFTRFMPPVPHPQLGFGEADWTIFTTYRVMEPLERLAESRNDNLKNDVAKYMGDVVVGGVPLKMVFWLEANDTSDPLYGVNWKVFRPFVKTGEHMVRSKPRPAPQQHRVRNVFVDNAMNYTCIDRRRTFVGSK